MTGSNICFITAIFGDYEKTCKSFVQQSIPADFICFTDNTNLISNGWSLIFDKYHLTHPSIFDSESYKNNIKNNKHTFNIAKYYKQAFINIPILNKYDVIVWIDGTIQINDPDTAKYILEKTKTHKIVAWNHERRSGILDKERQASVGCGRYHVTNWFDQDQPFQDVNEQYKQYLSEGFTESFFDDFKIKNPKYGVWVTCFISFLQKDISVNEFLHNWYLQTLKHTTQDQIGFTYSVWYTKLFPFTLPNEEISGDEPHKRTQFYIKHQHRK